VILSFLGRLRREDMPEDTLLKIKTRNVKDSGVSGLRWD
jgi:hypothetical protein